MKKRKQQKGFILLLVIAMIPLIGMVMAIMTANCKTLTFQTRSAELELKAENACLSGLAWIKHNPAKTDALPSASPLTLTLEAKPVKIHCLIEHNGQEKFQITGYAEEGRYSADCRRQWKK